MSAQSPLLYSTLEVNTATKGSLCLNPSARFGLARWSESGGVIAENGFRFPDGADASIAYTRFNVTPGRFVGARYELTSYPLFGTGGTPGQRRVKCQVTWYDSGGTVVGTVQNISEVLWQYPNPPVVNTPPTARQVPSGAVRARVSFTIADGGQIGMTMRGISIRHSATEAEALQPEDPADWLPIMGDAVRVEAEGGAVLDGVDDVLQSGTLVAVVNNPALDPAASGALRRGNAVRLRRTSGALIWSGVIETADTEYVGDKSAGLKPIITVTATDDARKLLNTPVPSSPNGGMPGRVAHAATRAGLFTLDQEGRLVTSGTGLAAAGDQTSAADWIRRAVNTDGGAVWVDPEPNVLRCVSVNNLSMDHTVTLTDRATGSGLHYTGISMAYGSRAFVNSLLVRAHSWDLANGSKVYGPFTAIDSAAKHDVVSAETDVIGGLPSASEVARRLLGRFAYPLRYPSSVTFDATENLATAFTIRPYSVIRVQNGSTFDGSVRVLKVKHTIGKDRWFITLETRPLETSTPVDVQDPELGADTGPDDVTGSRFNIGVVQLTQNQTIPNSTNAAVLHNTSNVAIGIEYDQSTGRYLITRAGRYDITTSVEWAGSSVGTRWARIMCRLANGSFVILASDRQGGQATGQTQKVSLSTMLYAGQAIYTSAVQNTGGNLQVIGNAAEPTTFLSIRAADS